MKRFFKSGVVATGLAMFSMFFGAGNVVFPLVLGREAGTGNFYAIMGLLITAVGAPFLGLVSMILFNGDYKKFFYRIGKVPGFFTMAFILAIIGPLHAIPRCLTLSYGAIKAYVPAISLFHFSILSALIIFIFCIKESKILDILGYVLSPILLASLGLVIVNGLLYHPAPVASTFSNTELFLKGFFKGYLTMDLLATMFFASMVLFMLKEKLGSKTSGDKKKLASMTFKASCVGAALLGLVYLGTSYVAAFQGSLLVGVHEDELLVTIARQGLGATMGVIASLAVAIACLTTAITLVVVVTDFLRFEVLDKKIGYTPALVSTIVVSAALANLGFEKIVGTIIPVLDIIYPAVIMLAGVNLIHKLFGFKYVKIPVYATFAVSLINYLR